jgi:hypothetical protein
VAVISLVVAIGGTAVALPGGRTVEGNDLRTDSVGARAIGDVMIGQVAGLASSDSIPKDGNFTEDEGTIRCPARAPFAFDPAISGLGPLAFEISRKVVVNRFGGPGGYIIRVTSDTGPVGFTMSVNCLPRR